MGLCPETPIAELFRRPLTDQQVRDMWYDWFCKETSLVNKGRKLLTRLKAISPSPRFDATKTYVFFKNNCPLHGKLYDDFRICDIKSGDVVYCVTPAEGYEVTSGQATVWGNTPGTKHEFRELVRGTWKDVKLFFQTTDENVLKELREWAARLETMRTAEYDNRQFDAERAAKIAHERISKRNEDCEYIEQLETMLAR